MRSAVSAAALALVVVACGSPAELRGTRLHDEHPCNDIDDHLDTGTHNDRRHRSGGAST